MPLIEVRKLEKIFGADGTPTKALAGIDLTILEGEFLSIIGPSGSGKSTLLQILGLLDPQSGGTYHLNGKDTSTFSDIELAQLRNKMMGFIFQSFNLLPRTSVLENVMLPLAYSHTPAKEWTALATKKIDAVNLSHRTLYEPSQLSGGEKQRVAIARALVTSPAIVFADEPTGNLDSASGRAVMDILEGLHHKEGKTVILITHDITLAKRAHRIIALQDGAIIWDGNAKDYQPKLPGV